MQMNFYSFDYSYQKESVVFQSEWLVIFDPRLLSCWSWWQQIPSPKSTVKLWDDDVSSWSTSFSDEGGKRCGMNSSEPARKSCFDDWKGVTVENENDCSFVSNTQHIKLFGCICPEKKTSGVEITRVTPFHQAYLCAEVHVSLWVIVNTCGHRSCRHLS